MREDPFFRKYAPAGAGKLYLSSATRVGLGMLSDDTLRPSQLSAVTVDAQPLVVTRVDRSILSGRLGAGFLQQQGLADDLAAYRTCGPPSAERTSRVAW